MELTLLAIIVTFLHLAPFAVTQGVTGGAPVFNVINNNNSIWISEDAPVGSTVWRLNVTSSGNTRQLLTVTCASPFDSSQTACSPFSLTALSQDNTKWIGTLNLGQQLNSLSKPFYFLTFAASDTQQTSYQNLSITVMNAQIRPPVFTGPTNANVNETDSLSNMIIQYRAVDGDTNNARQIYYKLVSNPGNYFRIEEVTGRLFNIRALSFSDPNWATGYISISVQAGELISPRVVGYDNPLTSTTVPSTISLNEVVDNAPVFGQQSYAGIVAEKSAIGTAVQGISITVTDRDKSLANSAFELYLDNFNNIFDIVPSNASRAVSASIVVKNSSALNYDLGPRTYQMNVIARETQSALRLSASASVNINISGINDFPPVFTQPVYSVAINETIPPGSFVIQVLATDQDYGFYGNQSIRYKFAGDTGSSLFTCDKFSGIITVAPCNSPGQGSCIDYERMKSYQLNILAVDNYGEGFTATTVLNITIIDVNDNPPVFNPSTYYGQIYEATKDPSPKIQVFATDKDSSYNGNNNVTYRISGGNDNNLWIIDRFTGVINATHPVYYQDTPGSQGYFLLTVEASDPDPSHNAGATVNISVTPVNNFSPVIDQNGTYSAKILETAAPGTEVETIHATDQDSPSTPNGQVRYRLSSGGLDKFVMNYTTGLVTVAPGATFDSATQDNYLITVVAQDLGTPQKSATGTLTVTIIPNRPEPKFIPSTIRPPPVLQSAAIGTNVITVFANNTNPNRLIMYSFVEPITGYNPMNQPVALNSTEKQMFAVDPGTGLVTVNQPLKYDRVATWQAVVQGVDMRGVNGTQTGTATIIITILPTNDKPPVFDYPWTPQNPLYNKSISNYKNPSPYLFTIDANSPNSSLGITYQLIDDYNGAFNISNQTGQIGLVRPLDFSRDKDVKFVMIAVDNGVPSLTSTATVYIELKQTNDYSPSFNETEFKAAIPEDAPAGTYVVTVKAFDQDPGDYGTVRYELTDSSSNRFQIDNTTGFITVAPNATFNGRVESLIILRVRAYDSPSDPLSSRYSDATVQVNISTMNRIPPLFTQSLYAISIVESRPPFTTIIQVLATKDNVAVVTYSILAGNDQGLFNIGQSNGSIFATMSLIGKVGTYNLTVLAKDNGSPQLNSTSLVMITVLSSTYSIPVWDIPSRDGEIVYINETERKNTYVTRVKAHNPNPQVNQNILYYMSISNGQGISTTTDFAINQSTGVITTARDFNYEGGKSFVLNVAAKDSFNTVAIRIITVYVLQQHLENPWFNFNKTDNCTYPIFFTISLNAPNNSIVGTVTANLNDTFDSINYNITTDGSNGLFDVQPSPDRRSARIIYFGNKVISQQTTYHLQLVAQDMYYNPSEVSPKGLCNNEANMTNVDIYISVILTEPKFDDNLHTCVANNADIGTVVYEFKNIDYDESIPVQYRTFSTTCASGNNVPCPGNDYFSLFNLSQDGILVTKQSVDPYNRKYLTVTANATYDSLSYSNPSLTVYVTPYDQEILVTLNQDPTVVTANISNIAREISKAANNGKVCVIAIKYHVTEQGVVDPKATDVFMYVINGSTNDVVSPLALDRVFVLQARKSNHIIGITAANSFWAGFIYHPVAAAIGIIIGLIVLALILFCCCCIIWTKILALCRYQGDKEPLIYKASSSLGVVNPVWSAKQPGMEEQVLTMPVPDGDGMDRTIALHGEYNRATIDTGDSDVFGAADVADTAAGLQGVGGGAPSLSGYVHIEAPLTASRSASAYGTASGYDASQTHQETSVFFDRTGAGQEMGIDSPYDDGRMSQRTSNIGTSANMDGQVGDSRASYSASGAMKFTRSTMADSPTLPRSHSSGMMTNGGATALGPDGPVRLNNPGDTGHAKIGATLFRPGGQAYAQSVISGTIPGDRYDGIDDGMYGTTNDARMALPLDTEMMYSHVRPTSYYDDADVISRQVPSEGGMYQGEVRLMPVTVGHSSISSEQFQETRFL